MVVKSPKIKILMLNLDGLGFNTGNGLYTSHQNNNIGAVRGHLGLIRHVQLDVAAMISLCKIRQAELENIIKRLLDFSATESLESVDKTPRTSKGKF